MDTMAANSSTYEDTAGMSARKREIRRRADASAPTRRRWLARSAFFHHEDLLYLKFLIPEGARVLELGCGTGDLLAALKPSFGVGVDFSAGMISEARKAHPELTFFVGDIEDPRFLRSLPGPFDAIVVVDTLGGLDDCQAMFASLHDLCTRETRVLVPARLFGLGRLINRFLAPLPLIRQLCLRHFTVSRSLRQATEVQSASIVVPARN